MNSDKSSYKKTIEEILTSTLSVRLANDADEEKVHQILESVSMKLQDGLELLYSRRPNLLESYYESLMEPLIFVDQNAENTTATISSTTYYLKGEKTPSYYSSDLRMSEKTTLSVKKDFASLYPKFVATIPDESIFTTAVLKENIRAMKLFSKLSHSLHYNPLFEIVTRSLVILPFAKRAKSTAFNFKIIPAQEIRAVDLEIFLEKKVKEASFSTDFFKARKRLQNSDEFVITDEHKQILAYFSLYQTKQRKILIKAKSLWINILLLFIRALSGNDLRQKIPWIYINNLIVGEELEKRTDLLTNIFTFLLRTNKIRSGELVSFTHLNNDSTPAPHYTQEGKGLKSFLGLPQINTETIFFRVENKAQDRLLTSKVLVDPTLL